ncbi:CSEP0269 putative effector protein [Blumeria hordei DH14]|uniref:CSEP0269 putative effector protein n=1 Tax=Blumeria graminis f. sp. hordei (strain DH14) TaxID=546991 RepID=N1JF49_BLUG1|nr:CSEP0269 putative effector protein [Blumeria hordei DH14]
MRYFNLAIILQSAALFVPTLADYKSPHINEGEKSFKCNKKIINASQYWEEKLLADNLMRQRQKIIVQAQGFYDVFWSRRETNLVLYDDNTASYFFDHKLTSIADVRKSRKFEFEIRYTLVIDNFGRVCAMFMNEQVVGEAGSSLKPELKPRYTKSFCTINS